MKTQAAIDFMLSYGIALIIIAIATAVIIKFGLNNPAFEAPECASAPGFTCQSFVLNTSGVLQLIMSQSTGGPIIINGAACSSNINSSSLAPAYGNVYITGNSIFYPAGTSMPIGPIQTNTYFTIKLYCYNQNGIATGTKGNGFIGVVFLNYTIPGYGIVKTMVVNPLVVRYS